MTCPNRLFTTWPDPFWVILMVIGGWLATTAPVGPLLKAFGLFMAVFCAQCLSRRQSKWEGYRRGFRAGWTRARSGSARGCSGRLTMALVIAVACGFGAAASVREQDAGVAGIWRYNEEMSTPLPQAAADGQGRAPREGAPPGGSGGGMRGGGMPPGMPGLGRGPSPEDMRRRRVVVSRLTEPPASLVIVRTTPG